MLSDLYLASNASLPPLRVGVLLDGPAVPAVFAQVLADIERSQFAALKLAIFKKDPTPVAAPAAAGSGRWLRYASDSVRRRQLGWTAYNKLDEKFCKTPCNAVALVDISDLLRDVDTLAVEPITKRFVHRFPEDTLEAIRGKQLDVLLRFGFNILRGDILSSARYGVWSFHHGDNEYYRGGPAHFWEMYEHNHLSGAVLQVLTEELDAGSILIKGVFGTEPGLSLIRNRMRPYWGSAHFVIQKLWELHTFGWPYVTGRTSASTNYSGKRKIYRTPTNAEVAKWAIPQLARKTVGRFWRTATRRHRTTHWRMAIRAGSAEAQPAGNPSMTGFRWIESPAGHFYADPFLVQNQDKHWVFFEDYYYREQRGVIACAELSPDGTPKETILALDPGMHCSYPYLFRENDDLYMIPETLVSGSVQLYKCIHFPNEWKFEAELFRGNVVDVSALQHNGRWYFFVTFVEPNAYGIAHYLFSAETIKGEWKYHPANPLSIDVRNARSAGAIQMWNGKLIRPTQDCSRRYGYAINFAEIVRLDPEVYEERPISTVLPDWSPGLLATHTYNRLGPFEVTDGLIWRFESKVYAK